MENNRNVTTVQDERRTAQEELELCDKAFAPEIARTQDKETACKNGEG